LVDTSLGEKLKLGQLNLNMRCRSQQNMMERLLNIRTSTEFRKV